MNSHGVPVNATPHLWDDLEGQAFSLLGSQATMAPEYQGRVFTLMASVATAMTPVGLLLATPIADLIGVRIW